MAIETRFVRDGLVKAQLNEFLAREFERAGYGGMEIRRTPLGTQITVIAERPGMIIGKGGRTIKRLTAEITEKFPLDNPQIDVQEVKVPELNPQMMAARLAATLERGWYFRMAGNSLLRNIMAAGALGCEIIVSGKLTGPRSRTQKFIQGYVKHSGRPAEELVREGYAVAVKKLGVIGCRVRIVPPDVNFPDKFNITVEGSGEEEETKETQPSIEGVIEKIEEEPKTEPEAVSTEESEAMVTEKMEEESIIVEEETHEEGEDVDVSPKMPPEGALSEEEGSIDYTPTLPGEQVRKRGDVIEHKHEGYDYWHPISRVHKTQKSEDAKRGDN
ncbi:MAG: 30S ribosomal protein S3 [Methermicoccaceae archaeon]